MSTGTNGDKKKHRPLTNSVKIVNANRTLPQGAHHMRDRATINRIQMYKSKAHYDSKGNFLGGDFMSRKTEKPVVRVAPDRRWFGNTRVVGQKELELFREQMGNKVHDPYTVVLRHQKLPMALIDTTNGGKQGKVDLLQVEPFSQTFGPKSQRKKAKNSEFAPDLETLIESAQLQNNEYESTDKREKDVQNKTVERDWMTNCELNPKLRKGTSKRIWNELYKVIDSSDVIIQVLDARDPMGTRCKRIEDELKTKERRHKHMIFVLNKCDLVPVWVTRAWISYLSQEYPTIAMHASITNPFGKSALLQVLKQLSKLHSDKKQISIGFVGYPNVGKSSLINTLSGSVVCPAAPIPGQTKHWRYITLFKRIYLIDCPGIVPPNHTSPVSNVLKGAVRVEQLDDPAEYIPHLMAQLRPEYLANQYGIPAWSSPMEFLELYCVRAGKMQKGGEPDTKTGARMILQDWLMGRLPHFTPPPHRQDGWVQLTAETYAGPDGMAMTTDEDGKAVPAFAPARAKKRKMLDQNRKERLAKGMAKASGEGDDAEEEDEDQEYFEDEDDDEDMETEEIVIDDSIMKANAAMDNESSDDGEDDGLNDGDDDEMDSKYLEVLKAYKKVERVDNRMEKLEQFDKSGQSKILDWQKDEWKTLNLKTKYRNFDMSEEQFLRQLEAKKKELEKLKSSGSEVALKQLQQLEAFNAQDHKMAITMGYELNPFGALAYKPAQEIILAGELEELTEDGGKTKSGEKTEGYVVTLVGGKTIKADGSETGTAEDLETLQLLNLQPKGTILDSADKIANPSKKLLNRNKDVALQAATLLNNKKPLVATSRAITNNDAITKATAAAAGGKTAQTTPVNKNNEKKKKMRAKQRLLGRW